MALALALIMVLAMGAVAFATSDTGDTEPVTVTVTNGEYDSEYFTKSADEINYEDHTYKAAQILAAAAYDATKKEYTGLSWGADVTDDGVALLAALQGDSTWGTTFENYVTAADEVDNTHPQFTAASFAKAIEGATADQAKALAQVLKSLYANTGTEITGTSAVTLPGIGYYLIDDVTAAADLTDDAANPVILLAAPGSNKVRIKADKPSQDKKIAEGTGKEVADFNIGDAVPYTIDSKIPNVENYKDYTMKFSDTMSDGLTLFDNWTGTTPTNVTPAALKITVGTTELTSSDMTYTPGDHGFTLELKVKEDGTLKEWATAGAAIKIEYFGVLNSSAEVGTAGNTNSSTLEYSNNPDDDESKTTTPPDKTIVFTYELDVNKIDGTTKEDLPGAQFALKATDGNHADKYVIVDATSGMVVGWADAAPAADAEPVDGKTSLLTSDEEGNFKVVGLDDGTYSLEEIKAPAGYNTIDPITIKVIGTKGTGDFTTDLEDDPDNALTKLEIEVDGEKADGDTATGIVNATVENNSGAQLPETGGIGTTIFYVAGSILVLAAVVLLVTKRRMNAGE